MKEQKSILAILFIFLLLPAVSVLGQEKDGERAGTSTASLRLTQCALKVSGMSCGSCAGMVERGLLNVEGVKQAKVDWKQGDVKVKYDKKTTTPEKIISAFNKANPGFRAELPKAKDK